MKKALKFLLPVLALIAAVGVSVVLFISRPPVEHRELNIKSPLVTVAPVRSETMGIPVFTRGTVTPGTEIQMVSEVSGQVLELSPNFANGGFFRKGEVLVKVDPIEYEVNLKRAEASKAQARQAMLQAEAEKKARSRIRNASKNQLASYDIQYRQAKAQYDATVAELEAVKLQKSRTTVRAPFDGRVRLAALNVGQFVRPGQQMGSIYAVDVAEIRLPLSDRQLALVDVPMRFQDGTEKTLPEVTLTDEYAGRTYSWKGKVVRAEGGVDERNRLLYVVAQVADPYSPDPNQPGRPELVAGSFVEATIDGRQFENVFEVPRKALRNGSQLWVVDDNSRLVEKDVAIIYKAKDHIYVSSGLEDGDKVVLSQMDIAVDGMEVRTQELQQDLQPEVPRKPDDLFGNSNTQKEKPVIQLPDSKPSEVNALAKQAKDRFEQLSQEQKNNLKEKSEKLVNQVRDLGQALNSTEPSKAAEKTSVEPEIETAQPARATMSPLAAALERDIAEQEAEEESPVIPNQTPTPTPTPSPTPNKASKAGSQFVTATVEAPEALQEARQ